MNIQIRQALTTDIDLIHGIELSSFSSPWSKNSFMSALESDNIRIICAFDESSSNSAILGFAVYASVADEAELMDIAVAKEFRGLGIGNALITHMNAHLLSLGVSSVFLEVRLSNVNARSLYEKNGFSVIGIRKNYYSKPTEDAVLMSKPLI